MEFIGNAGFGSALVWCATYNLTTLMSLHKRRRIRGEVDQLIKGLVDLTKGLDTELQTVEIAWNKWGCEGMVMHDIHRVFLP